MVHKLPESKGKAKDKGC